VAAIDQEEMDALEDLKATNEIITTSFKNDLLMLQNKHKALTTDHEQQKTQLIDALLSKDRFMKDLASFKERTTTNGDDSDQKAQSKAIIEEGKARKALQEVSNMKSAPSPPSPARTGGGFLKTLSRLSLLAFLPTAQTAGREPENEPTPAPEISLETAQATLGNLESLKRERSAIGQVSPRPPYLFFNPYTSSAQTVEPEPVPEAVQATLGTLKLTLEREHSIFDGAPPMLRPLISPSSIPLPASPIRTRSERADLKRCMRQRAL
jgi:hypothetical protein